jgi:hypothetical protein
MLMTVKLAYLRSDGLRTCAKCGSAYPPTHEYFFKHSQRSDGFHSWCKPCCKEGNKRSIEKKYATFDGRISTFLSSCRRAAEKRGNEFSLTRNDFERMWEMQQGVCAYSGWPLALEPNTPFSVSVERVDSRIGYTDENTVLVCRVINTMKSDIKPEMFYEACRAVTLWLSDATLERGTEFSKYG